MLWFILYWILTYLNIGLQSLVTVTTCADNMLQRLLLDSLLSCSYSDPNSRLTSAGIVDGFQPDRNTAQKQKKSDRRRCTVRFFPLIIDEEHALRALPLLEEEILRMDCLTEDNYEFPVARDQPPVVTCGQLKIQKLPIFK